jgi:starvation-inducible DNA-binding protein
MSEINEYLKEAEVAVLVPAPNMLADTLTKVLADTIVFYFKAHTFHWNVTGSNFPQYHEFLGNVYEQVYGNVDRLAEEIRALGVMAPKNLSSLIAVSNLTENRDELDAIGMFASLAADNQKILGGLLGCQKMAEAANQVGLANYLQDLFDAHKKLAWMLSSILK